jgi:hypothetical protein
MEKQENSENQTHLSSSSGSGCYEIKIQGHIDQVWSKWFEGMKMTHVQNEASGLAYTLLSGPIIDQPALHGLLAKIRDLNMTLLSVSRIDAEKNTSEKVDIG